MRRGMAAVLVALAAAVAVAGAAASAAAQQVKPEYKSSLVVGPKGPWGEAAQRFAELVRERTKGRINIKNYYAGQLFAGKQTNEFLLLRQGVADFAWGSTINWSTTVKELNLFSLPFFFPDYKALDAVEHGEAGKVLFRLIEEKGVVGLAWAENGFRELTNGKRPVKSPGDLEGLKVRVVGSPIFIDTFKALGGNPISMNWGEAVTAFQQGTVDGQENPINSVITPYKLWTVHRYMTVWHYAIDPIIVGVSKQTWDTLSAEDQAIIRKTAEETAAWQKAAAREGLEGMAPGLEQMRQNGMEVTVLTGPGLQAFKERTKAVSDKWVPEIGPELVEMARRDVARAK